MTPDFQRLMQDATRLTRSGQLEAATAAIQAALAPGGGAAPTGDVIDVEARFLPEPGDAPPRRPAAGIDPGEPAPSPSPGEPAFVAGRFGTGAAARDYKLYIPPQAGSQPLPLVVMLHGCTQDPDDFAAGTAMNDAALEQGFFVLYPAQSAKANPQRCWNWFKHSHQQRGRGEPAILAGMVSDVMARHAVDPARVYVAGLSAGGAMAAIMGQAYPDLFAAVGVHSGLAAGAARDLPSALQAMKEGRAGAAVSGLPPTIVFHGDADGTVHPSNGEHAYTAGAAAGDTVRSESGRSAGGRAWTRRLRVDAAGRVVAEHWRVQGSPHAWSGGSRRGSYTDPAGPSATQEMLRFFMEHPRTGARPQG